MPTSIPGISKLPKIAKADPPDVITFPPFSVK
jgi:hypothetical protein